MGNNFFRFRQFVVHQEKAAMKVGTDGVLLGAWADCSTATRVLDIGSGTGLVSIMLAQRCNAEIDAVEIDENSYLQSLENISTCPWRERITAHHMPIQEYKKTTSGKYDLVVSNPPYFVNSLKPGNAGKNISCHNDLLPFPDIINAVNTLLEDSGKFSLILPYTEGLLFIEQCSRSALFCSKKTTVFPCPWKKPSRLLLEFRKTESLLTEGSITIELNQRHGYSPEYVSLTKEFYL